MTGNPILGLPHLVFSIILLAPFFVVSAIAFIFILIIGRYPMGLFKFSVAIVRYQWRVVSFLLFMRGGYPSFSLAPRSIDSGKDPATLSIYYPRRLNRLLALFKGIMVIPALLLWCILIVPGLLMGIISYFSVLISGSWSNGIRKYQVGIIRWAIRISVYVLFLTDAYPGLRVRV